MIRSAVSRDAQAIGDLKVRAWREAYDGFMSREYLRGPDPVKEADEWAEYLAELRDEHRLWISQEAMP
ncbi:hypothetical protein [Streptomyces sp. NPDC052042]|uniref:hypothetical protein n=1 Tax=Streptomyces sp. NPDC052042 TaxID=3365683 RepID=UPI0037D1C1FD